MSDLSLSTWTESSSHKTGPWSFLDPAEEPALHTIDCTDLWHHVLKVLQLLSLIAQENLYQQLLLAANTWKNKEGLLLPKASEFHLRPVMNTRIPSHFYNGSLALLSYERLWDCQAGMTVNQYISISLFFQASVYFFHFHRHYTTSTGKWINIK